MIMLGKGSTKGEFFSLKLFLLFEMDEIVKSF